MRLRNHRYLAPNPDGPSGTGTAEPSATASPPPSTEPPPSTGTEPAPPADGKSDAGDNSPSSSEKFEPAAKINSLLDKIGQPDEQGEPEAGAKAPDEPVAPPTGTKAPVDPAKAPTDPKAFDLTPPEGMTERSKTRWTELADRAKQVPVLEQRATAAENSLNQVRTVIQESGLDPEEFGNVIQIGRLYKSNDAAELQSALEQLDGLRANVATRLGIEAPGVDILAKHPDLAAEVEDMSISRERAIELAAARDLKARTTQQQQSSNELDQFKRNVTAAASDMETQLAARAATPGHAEKMAFLNAKLADPVYQKQFVSTYQPKQWAAAMLMLYDAYNPPAAGPTTPRPPQPLRPGHVNAGTRTSAGKPVTAIDAVKSAWDQAGLG